MVALPNIADLTANLPSVADIAQGALLSLGVGIATKGITASAADGSFDPLGLFNHVHATAQANPAVANTLTLAAFVTLPPDTQKALLAAGVKVSG